MLRRLGGCGVVVACVLAAAPARAQDGNTLAIGVAYDTMSPVSGSMNGGSGFTALWRIGHDRSGWTWNYALLNWYETTVPDPLARGAMLGELHVRPLMGGYGYTVVNGRWAITGDVLAGYAFTSFKLTAPSVDGAGPATVDSANAFTAKPEINVWYDVSDKVGINLNSGYIFARPTLSIATPSGISTRPFHADVFMFGVGFVFSIF